MDIALQDLNTTHYALFAILLVIGLILGWILRSDRSAREKIAINAGWQEQIEAQQGEHDRLAGQNKSLMEQISQYQASHKDNTNRAKELSDSLRETFARRDDLQRQLKDIRGELDVATAQRDRYKAELDRREASRESQKDKDDKIFRLSRELTSWQSRVPPLVEKFQTRDQEARELERELEEAQARIAALEATVKSDNTHIEPVEAGDLPDGLDASNEPHDEQAAADVVALERSREDPDADLPHDEDAAAQQVASEGDGEEVAVEHISTGLIPDDHETINASKATIGIRDDLKMIKGVGPAIEKTLNDLGIFRFNQIAEMSEYDIDRVAQRLKGFRSRIYREDWIGQARDLQYQKNNDLV